MSYDKYLNGEKLPLSYAKMGEDNLSIPTLFVSGDKNLIFPGSNKVTFDFLKSSKNRVLFTYQEFPNYGHQDVFMGKNSYKDIFPTFLKFIKEHSNDR